MGKKLLSLLLVLVLCLSCALGLAETEETEEAAVEQMESAIIKVEEETEEAEEAETEVDEAETEADEAETEADEAETEAAGDDDFINFTPVVLNNLGRSASEFMASGSMRAALTVLCALELDLQLGNDEAEWMYALLNTSYVAVSDDAILVVYLMGEAQDAVLLFAPEIEMTSYYIFDSIGSTVMAEAILEAMDCTYYENDASDISDAISALSEALND